jgi:hypothetical protein
MIPEAALSIGADRLLCSILPPYNGASATSLSASREGVVSLGNLQHHQPTTTVCEQRRSGAKSFGALTPVLSVVHFIP